MTAALDRLGQPGAHGYTTADLHALPSDGRRYELIDGSMIVSPPATVDHNTVARWLAQILEDSCPGVDFVVGADQAATIDEHNEPRPDVAVIRAEHLRRSPFPIVDATLVVEVVSPTSTLHDTETKRALYAAAGVPSYWIVVPQEDEATIGLTELVLDEPGGRYRSVNQHNTEEFETDRPWPVRVDLPALTAQRARLTWLPPDRDTR